MYHGRFHGTHYDIGYRWGALLAKHGKFLLDNIGFPITQDRLDFSVNCLPVYQTCFPEILAEIKGLADGQGCDERKLQAFLFSMYAMPPQPHCSCFAVSNGKQILFGRNSDFLTALEKSNMNVIYHFDGDSYSFTGNTTAFLQMEDGVNEHGLAIGLTSVYPPAIRPGMNAGMLLRYFLEKCKNVQEVIEQIQRLPIASAQTFTVADTSGEITVLECYCDGLEIIWPSLDRPFVCATNIFHAPAMQQLNMPDLDNWDAEPRYQTMTNALSSIAGSISFENAADLLSGKLGFLCQYNRTTGKDTVWSVIYDLKNRRIFRAEANPARRDFKEDLRFHMNK